MRNPVECYSDEGFVEHKIELGDEDLEEIIREYLERDADFDSTRRLKRPVAIAKQHAGDVAAAVRGDRVAHASSCDQRLRRGGSTSFQDKRVLITGATSDIGVYVVSRLADAGALIVMLGRSQRKLEQIGASVATCRHRPACVTVDLLCSEGIETAVRGILEDLKGIDIFLHLAGVWHDGTARYQGPEYWQTPL